MYDSVFFVTAIRPLRVSVVFWRTSMSNLDFTSQNEQRYKYIHMKWFSRHPEIPCTHRAGHNFPFLTISFIDGETFASHLLSIELLDEITGIRFLLGISVCRTSVGPAAGSSAGQMAIHF